MLLPVAKTKTREGEWPSAHSYLGEQNVISFVGKEGSRRGAAGEKKGRGEGWGEREEIEKTPALSGHVHWVGQLIAQKAEKRQQGEWRGGALGL